MSRMSLRTIVRFDWSCFAVSAAVGDTRASFGRSTAGEVCNREQRPPVVGNAVASIPVFGSDAARLWRLSSHHRAILRLNCFRFALGHFGIVAPFRLAAVDGTQSKLSDPPACPAADRSLLWRQESTSRTVSARGHRQRYGDLPTASVS